MPHAQAEMMQKEQQIQALKAKKKSRSTLMPLLMNGVATCERKVSEEVSALPATLLWRDRNNIYPASAYFDRCAVEILSLRQVTV